MRLWNKQFFAHVNHARIRSWNQPVLSNESKGSCSRKQRGPLMGIRIIVNVIQYNLSRIVGYCVWWNHCWTKVFDRRSFSSFSLWGTSTKNQDQTMISPNIVDNGFVAYSDVVISKCMCLKVFSKTVPGFLQYTNKETSCILFYNKIWLLPQT